MTQLHTALLSVFLLVFLSGCSWLPFRSQDPLKGDLSAETLLSRGEAEFEKKKYTQAIRYFQKLKDDYPFAPQAIEVELRLAEAHYRNKQYPEATASFKDFLALHPAHGSVPFVLYHLGLIHFDQFNGIERDQKNTEIAKGYFESVARDHPNSQHAGLAKEKLAQCLVYLAEHQLTIASFYRREEKYPAARDRLEAILRLYRETPAAAKALYQLGEIYGQEKNQAKAALAYEALIQHYPKSDLAKEAQIRLAQLEKTRQDPLETLLASSEEARKPASQKASQPNGIPASQLPKETALVAKKGVVHEEPGDEKGVFRRAAESLNPVSWFSSGEDKKEEKKEPDRPAKKANSKAPVKTDPELIAKVDKTLEQRGVALEKNLEIRPPAVSLPTMEEAPSKRVADTPALLGAIDARLKSQGKDGAELPPAPEGLILPVPAAASRIEAKPAASKAGLLGDIDRALKQKGIEPPKDSAQARKLESSETEKPSSLPASKPPSQIQLQPKMPSEKGPLFLETGEYQIPDKPAEGEEAGKRESQEASQPPSMPASQLPQAVVQGPPQIAKEKAPETKPAEKKNDDAAEEEEQPKGLFDQIKEDIESIGRVLNPFKW